MLLNRRLILFFRSTNGNQADLLASKLDLIFITGLQFLQGGVSVADHQVAVALNGWCVGELSAAFTYATTSTKRNTLGFKQSLVTVS